MTFCRRYIGKPNANDEGNSSAAYEYGGTVFANGGHPLGGKKVRKGRLFTLERKESEQAHRYALFNSDSEEVDLCIK